MNIFLLWQKVVCDLTVEGYQDESAIRGKELKLQKLIQINMFLIIMST